MNQYVYIEVKDSKAIRKKNRGKFGYRKHDPVLLPRRDFDGVVIYGSSLDDLLTILSEKEINEFLNSPLTDQHLIKRFGLEQQTDVFMVDLLWNVPEDVDVCISFLSRNDKTRFYRNHYIRLSKESDGGDYYDPVFFLSKHVLEERERLTSAPEK